MKKSESSPINSLLSGRTSLAEIVITAIFIGFGISLSVSSLTLFENFNALMGFYTGLMICIVSLVFISKRVIIRKKNYTFDGFFILNEKENKIIDIPRYKFTEDIHTFFESAFTENKALEHFWNSEPLKLQDDLKIPEPRSVNIIRESIEYFLLDSLSNHLITYFKYPAEHKKNITVFERDQIPNVLLQNRFLQLFSKPIHDREHFIGIEETLRDDEDWHILDVDGALFRKFLLVLPRKSEVQRTHNKQIVIKTKRFILEMNVEFDRTNTTLPEGYLEHYLGINGFDEYLINVVYDVKIHISVNLKYRSLFSRTGWEDFKWIDSFIDKLNQSFSKEQYFHDINWNTAYTIIRSLKKKADKMRV
jgi:hypothetical protein